ncbi:MAG: hypothetical protein AAF902_03580, partial [Chloroflexota bacterium]
MGGRGRPMMRGGRHRTLWIDTQKRGYAVVTSEERQSGASYAFLDQLPVAGQEEKAYFDKALEQKRWVIISRDPNNKVEYNPHQAHNFHDQEPTLMWFKDGQEKHLYIEGVTTQEFLERSGLSFTYERGAEAKLFKRMSRVMRSYVVEQRFDRSEVRIERIQDDRLRNVFDGAGVISREMLDKFVLR